jgi:hypothetical protein
MNVRRVVTALASLLLMTLAIPAFASPRIVRLSYLAGDVRIDRNKAAGVERAILNMPVVEGTRIYSVGDDARVEIEFENGSTMRLVGNGEVAFRQLGSIDNGNKQSVVDMVHGLAYFDVKNHDGDDFRVMLHDRDVTVRKTSHFRISLEDPETTVAVFNGELELEGQAARVLVKKNETLSLETEDHSRYFLAKQITTLEGDSFDLERAQYIASHARSDAYEYAGVSYGSPYSYGLSDMASYGSYAYYPGYGYLWRPAGFGIGWDPFSYGVWSYYSGPGWVFVSPYAWGWTPYRYGRWVNVPGRGWCWGPYGRIGGGWYSVPVVYGSYPGRHIQRGHGPIPVPWVRPPHHDGGRSVSFGGGGLNGRPEGFDRGQRPGPAYGPNGRPDGRGGRNGGAIPVPGVAGNGHSNPTNGGLSVQGGALTSHGGPITSPGGAVTSPGGAVRPVVPGNGRDIGDNRNIGDRNNGRDGDWADRNRQNGNHRWQAPPVSNQAAGAPGAAAAVTPRESPAIPHEPMRRFDPPAVSNSPSQRMSAPPVSAPAASVPARSAAPAISIPASAPMSHPAPAMSAPAAAPAARPSSPAMAPAGRGSEPRPRAFVGSGASMGGGRSEMRGGGMSSGGGISRGSAPSAPSFHGGGGGSSHSGGGAASRSSGGGGGGHSSGRGR